MKYEDLLKDAKELENGCIVWTKSCSKGGYGQKGVNGIKMYTHRLVTEMFYGAPKPNQYALHSCDNPPCINPEHLRWGTAKQNVADMYARGRNRNGQLKGEEHGRAVLTKEDVVEIRILSSHGFTLKDLAKIYNVSFSTISLIVQRKLWKEVPEIGSFFTR